MTTIMLASQHDKTEVYLSDTQTAKNEAFAVETSFCTVIHQVYHRQQFISGGNNIHNSMPAHI